MTYPNLTQEESDRLVALETEALDALLTAHSLDLRDWMLPAEAAEYEALLDKMGRAAGPAC